MKELEKYLGTTYSDSCHPAIMTETAATFHEPEMPSINVLVIVSPKKYAEVTYLKKKNID